VHSACADESVSKGVAPARITSASATVIKIRVMAAQVSFGGCWYDDKLNYLKSACELDATADRTRILSQETPVDQDAEVGVAEGREARGAFPKPLAESFTYLTMPPFSSAV
jgi:hypothetical protein